MKSSRVSLTILSRFFFTGIVAVFAAQPCLAEAHPDYDRGRDRYEHDHMRPYRNSGRWEHTNHASRYGWWWVDGGVWSLRPRPVTTYIVSSPAPAPIIVAAPTAAVPSERPPEAAAAPPASYYFCESSQLFYPYAKTCSEKWKAVAPMPEAP